MTLEQRNTLANEFLDIRGRKGKIVAEHIDDFITEEFNHWRRSKSSTSGILTRNMRKAQAENQKTSNNNKRQRSLTPQREVASESNERNSLAECLNEQDVGVSKEEEIMEEQQIEDARNLSDVLPVEIDETDFTLLAGVSSQSIMIASPSNNDLALIDESTNLFTLDSHEHDEK